MTQPARKPLNNLPQNEGAQYAIAEALRSVSAAQSQTTELLRELQQDGRETRAAVQDVRERMIRIETKDVSSEISELRTENKDLSTRVALLETDKQRREGAAGALRFAKDYLPGLVVVIGAVVIFMQAGGFS